MNAALGRTSMKNMDLCSIKHGEISPLVFLSSRFIVGQADGIGNACTPPNFTRALLFRVM